MDKKRNVKSKRESSKSEAPEQDLEVPDIEESQTSPHDTQDPFGDESNAQIKYRTVAWWYVLGPATIMKPTNNSRTGRQA